MKKISALVLVALLLTSCSSDSLREAPGFKFSTNSSWQDGTIEPGYGNRWIIRNSSGRRIGTLTPDHGGRWIIRNTDGHRVGTVEGR